MLAARARILVGSSLIDGSLKYSPAGSAGSNTVAGGAPPSSPGWTSAARRRPGAARQICFKVTGTSPSLTCFPIFATFSPHFSQRSAAIVGPLAENPRDSGDFPVAATSRHCGTGTSNRATEITIAP